MVECEVLDGVECWIADVAGWVARRCSEKLVGNDSA